MKALLTITAFVLLCSFQTEPPKFYKFEFTAQEIDIIYQTLDNAPLPGDIRKPLMNKIAAQFKPQQEADSIKNKKK